MSQGPGLGTGGEPGRAGPPHHAVRSPALEVLQEEDLMEEDDIPVRSYFPENWLWRVESVDRFLQ